MGPGGNEVDVTMFNSCGYVRLDAANHTAAPFTEGGSGPSGSGGPTPAPAADGERGAPADTPTPVTPPVKDTAETTSPPDSGSVPPPPEPHPETAEARLRREAVSRRHLMTHLPKNPYCPICQGAKIRAAPAKPQQRRSGNPEVDPQRFCDLLLADHIVLVDPEAKGSKGESAGLM